VCLNMEQDRKENMESDVVESDDLILSNEEDEETDEEVERLTSPSPSRPRDKMESQPDPQAALMAGLKPKYVELPPEKHDNHIEADALSSRPSDSNTVVHQMDLSINGNGLGYQFMDSSPERLFNPIHVSATSSLAGTPVFDIEHPRRQKRISESTSTSGVMLDMNRMVLERLRNEEHSSLLPVHIELFDLRTSDFCQRKSLKLDYKIPGTITEYNSEHEIDIAQIILEKYGDKEKDVVWTEPKLVKYRDIVQVQYQHFGMIKAIICRKTSGEEHFKDVAFIRFIQDSEAVYPREIYAGILDSNFAPSDLIEWSFKKQQGLLQKAEYQSIKDTEFKVFVQHENSTELKQMKTLSSLVKLSTIWIVNKIPLTATLLYFMSDNAKMELFYKGYLTDTLCEIQQGIIREFSAAMGIDKSSQHIWLCKVTNDSMTGPPLRDADCAAFLHLQVMPQRFFDVGYNHSVFDSHFVQMIKKFVMDVEDPRSMYVEVTYRRSKTPTGRRRLAVSTSGYNSEDLVIIPPDCSVAYLKRKLAKRFGIPPCRQKLQLDKTKLRDDKVLQTYSHFKEGCMIIMLEATPLKIILMCSDEKYFSMEVFKSQTVQSVKANLGQYCGNISPYNISLSMSDSGEYMESESYLYQYNISRSLDTKIRALYFPKRADIIIIHRHRKFACTVDETDSCTIKKLKEHLEGSTKLASKDQILISRDRCLDDDVVIEGHSVIIVAERSKTWWYMEKTEAKEVKEHRELRIVCQSGYKDNILVDNELYEAPVVKGKMYLDKTPLDPAANTDTAEEVSLNQHGSCCGITIRAATRGSHISNASHQKIAKSTSHSSVHDIDTLDSISSTRSSEVKTADTIAIGEPSEIPIGLHDAPAATCPALEVESDPDSFCSMNSIKETEIAPKDDDQSKEICKPNSHDFPPEMFHQREIKNFLREISPSHPQRVTVEVKQKKTADEWTQSIIYSSDTNPDPDTDSGLSILERSGSIQPLDLGPDCMSDREVRAVAEQMGKDCKQLGRALDIDENALSYIERNFKDDQHEQNIQVLIKWKKKGRAATKDVLVEALKAVGRQDIIDKFPFLHQLEMNDSVS
ncbi:unnamed protein product, partial [Owenia fusiformis]